ncbi:MAG: amino acid permease [Candidatus Latescibacteria bacterium]|nr:amino acid permease [Candidatus Latescibacterota bacterium]
MADAPVSAGEGRFELETELARDLGLLSATTIIIGGIIGSGIFGAPAGIAKQLGSPGLIMLVWVIGGILSFCGAVCFAELGGMIPRTGGQFIYLRQAYPPIIAFLYGWTEVYMISAASVAAIAVVFTSYLGYFLPAISPDNPLLTIGGFVLSTQHAVILACVIFLGAVNYFGVRFGGFVQNLFTIAKVTALGGLVLVVAAAGGEWGHFRPLLPESPQPGLMEAFGAAMIGTMFAYNGWASANMVTGEIKDPQRQLPRAIFVGLFVCIAVYLAVNWSFIYVMAVEEIAASPRIAADVAERVVGPIGGSLISFAVMISTFGTINANMLSPPRIIYAMAKEGLFFRWLNYVHPVYRTPSRSIVALTVWASLWTFLGSFQAIVDAFAYSLYTFYSLSVISLFLVRRKYPIAVRPVKAWGYPVTPIIFLAISAWYVSTVLIFKTRESLPGLAFLAVGVVVYVVWFRKTR